MKKIFLIITLIILSIYTRADIIASGNCGSNGDNLTWVLSDDSILTISGTGAMCEFKANTVPWSELSYSIKRIVIEDGVTSIGKYAFSDLCWIESITMPESIKSIGQFAFNNCYRLASINLPNSLTSIGFMAFYKCECLTSLIIPKSVKTIGGRTFEECSHLSSIYILNEIPPSCGSCNFICTNETLKDKYEVYNYTSLHVPMGSAKNYSTAFDWRYFNHIKEDMTMNGTTYYAKLRIVQGESNYTEQSVKADESYIVNIGSNKSKKIKSVKFNGEDVTEDVIDGTYKTPRIKESSILSITFDDDLGDVNNDGMIDSQDVLKIYEYMKNK